MLAAMDRLRMTVLALTFVVTASGCLKKIALSSVADAMSGQGTVYASDNDPELVRDAIPFALKTMEQLADALPRHAGIRVALDRTCTSLAVGFYKDEAERTEDRDVAASKPLYKRAKKMSLRARDYGLDAFDLRVPGAKKAFLSGDRAAEKAALDKMTKADVEMLYWLGASWASAISVGKDDMDLVGQLPRVGLVMERALALDESWDQGTLHEFFILFDTARGTEQGGGNKKALAHYERALELDKGSRLSPKVSLAETVMIDTQNKKEFTRLLTEVREADVDAHPTERLVNILAQRRAAWLLARTDELFAE